MSKHKKTGKKHSLNSLADITINDFANSSVCKNRIKKSTANVNKVLKQLEDDKSWDEKIEEFDGDFQAKENEDGTITYIIQKTETRRGRKKLTSSNDIEDNRDTGKEYPIDIWFLISDYIRPEDVGRFAGICRASYGVVCTAKFWFSMYKRYYKSVPNMPERLQPECLFRKYGLRTLVIRALNFMYKPFILRLKSAQTAAQHPDVLRKSRCVLMWTKKAKSQWVYSFKMKIKGLEERTQCRQNQTRPDLLEMLDDVFANQDESCRLLQVTCRHRIPIPPVLGLTLTQAQLNLSTELRFYKLQLWFGSEFQSYSRSSSIGGSGNTLVCLESVINVRVLDWWHPLYPHTYNMESLFNRE